MTRADLEAIQRLVNEFRAELAALGVRVTAIEEELNAIKAKLDNVRITGGFRFRYDDQRFASGTPVNGNPQTGSTDASANPVVPRPREVLKLVFDGSVAPDIHLIAAFLTGGGVGGQTYQIFNSSNFGCGGNGSLCQYMFGSVDNLFIDWKNAWGTPFEFWLGRFGGSGIGFGTHPVQFGPFGLLMNTAGDTWEDTTADSGANVVDGFYFTSSWPQFADLRFQGVITRVTGNVGSTSYFSGEDAYGLDASIGIIPGLRVGANYVANTFTNPGSFAGPAPNGTLWHLYGPGAGGKNPATANCPATATGIQCPASGSGWDGYVQWDIIPGIHFDGEYAQWNDAVHGSSDNGWQVNFTVDLGTLTGVGHNFSAQVGYLNYGANFYPPYGAAEADIAMDDVLYPGNAQGVTAQLSFDPITNWTIYGIGFFGNNVSNGQNLTEYEAGVVYKFAPSAKITFKIRDLRINNVDQHLLYRAQIDYTF